MNVLARFWVKEITHHHTTTPGDQCATIKLAAAYNNGKRGAFIADRRALVEQINRFRGPVLARFDGVEWRPLVPSLPLRLQPGANLRVAGAPVRYEMTLEPQRMTVLPLVAANGGVVMVNYYPLFVNQACRDWSAARAAEVTSLWRLAAA